MKKFLLGALLLLSTTLFSQTTIVGNLIIDEDTLIGQNCGGGNGIETITYTGDLNFNDNYTLRLKGVNLIIQGNINGNGNIMNFCNNIISNICGTLQPNSSINIIGPTFCGNVLTSPTFTFTSEHYGNKYKVYDISGKLLLEGITNEKTFDELPKGQLLIVKVDNFKGFKTYKTN